jgi:hypothetical protein
LIANDYGLGILFMLVFVAVICAILLWRRLPAFRRWLKAIAPAAIPAALLPANPALALMALAGNLIPLPSIQLSPTLIMLVATVARIPRLFDSFWYDEAFTYRIATLRLDQLPAAIIQDVHPPLHYSIIWLWARVGGTDSEALLRLPALAAGLFSVWLLYRVALASGLPRRAALIAMLIVALMPAAIYYSAELRQYSMLSCAVFLAALGLLTGKHWQFILGTILTGWLHNLGLFYVVTLVISALVWRREFRLRTILATGAAACAFVPLIAVQSSHIADGFWIHWTAAQPLWLFVFPLLYIETAYLLAVLPAQIAIVLASFAAARSWLADRRGALLLLIMVLPVLLVSAASIVWRPVFLARPFLPVLMLACLPVALAVHQHARLFRSAIVPVAAVALLTFYARSVYTRPDYREYVERGCTGADAMYYTSIEGALTMQPYWHDAPAAIWDGASDKGETFTISDMVAYDFHMDSIGSLPGDVCVILMDTPRTPQIERDHIAQIVATGNVSSHFQIQAHPAMVINAYVLSGAK